MQQNQNHYQRYYPETQAYLEEDYVSIPRVHRPRDIDRVTSEQRNSLIHKLKAPGIPEDGFFHSAIDMSSDFNYVPLITAALDREMNIVLQKQISRLKATGQEQELKSMFFEILPEMARISRDSYGNFVIQRLVESVDTSLIDMAILNLRKDLQSLAVNQYGCRVVQRLILRCSQEARHVIKNEMLDDIVNVMASLYGGYTMQTLIQTIPSYGLLDLLKNVLIPKVNELCTAQHSSHVMQHVMRFFEASHKVELTKKILDNIVTLSKDKHANYVVQNMIAYGDIHTRSLALKLITPHIVEFSKDKAASNVIECCVKHATVEQNLDLLNTFLEEEKEFVSVLGHKYGNFVVKCMLKFLPIEQRRVLSNALLKRFQSFNDNLEALNVYETFLYKLVLRK